MKIVLSAIILLSLVCGCAFAEDTGAQKKDFNLVAGSPNSVVGVVKRSIPADLAGLRPAITITDDSGKDIDFTLKANTVIYTGVDGRLLSVKEIPAGGKVQVGYEIIKGVNYASAVRLVPVEAIAAGRVEPVSIPEKKENMK